MDFIFNPEPTLRRKNLLDDHNTIEKLMRFLEHKQQNLNENEAVNYGKALLEGSIYSRVELTPVQKTIPLSITTRV